MIVPNTPTTLPLAQITPGENPRRYFDKAKHDELVTSLRLHGLLQPLLLRPVGDKHVIVAGERRYRAALEAFGRDGAVPVVIRKMTDQKALEAAIDENDVREDASETEQADAAVRVLAACQGDSAEAAKRLGWSPAKLDRRLRLANLSEPVKLALDERRIKVGHAELLAAVPSDKQEKALDTIIGAGLEVSRTRELLMRMTQSLGAATFDKAECTTCPFNAGTQRALFETHVDDGHCTNAGCFQLKTEAADAERAAAKNSGAASGEKSPAGMPEDAHPSTPDRVSDPCPDQAPAPSEGQAKSSPKAAEAPTKPGRNAQPAKVTVSAAAVAARVADVREAAWRTALVQACEGDPEIAAAFGATLRDTWRVDEKFLGRFGKDELKFIAQECGLVAHMGEKAFAKLLGAKLPALITGMLNATGFDWAGRLPSAITLDGQYGPPPAATAPALTEKA